MRVVELNEYDWRAGWTVQEGSAHFFDGASETASPRLTSLACAPSAVKGRGVDEASSAVGRSFWSTSCDV